ncbi:flagellar biosynthetic protein FliQ [Burkholderia ubonensis]|uniref:flagellar biosynthetic protein FliQ n=1 Tax=Burkholderia ubonensis TaxID=101571 RepID=UPI000758272B|nr:flagellar biosynthetic protein FliQ [Burkholderia ubonensis]KVO87653.1 flagellar biosynthetic protein FliQ [Burkholderia ubonensis]KVZ57270.1 flagellar biosynthetic protein FliQ [Burkholderia ubonensis]KVZ72968.1 flagellar biosynthetic protein FliQ [Burkholderia ubonensis]
MLTPDLAASFAMDALRLVLVVVLVLITPGLVTGLLVSLFQAATQINEQTMSFLPRLVVTLIALAFAGHWVLDRIMHYTVETFQRAGQMVG